MILFRGRGRIRHRPGEMNKLEAAYNEHLGKLKAVGAIQWFKFEGIKLKLADKTYYTPDFLILMADTSLECHDVKGFWEDDARVKIKVVAAIYPFKFVGVSRKRISDPWACEEI